VEIALGWLFSYGFAYVFFRFKLGIFVCLIVNRLFNINKKNKIHSLLDSLLHKDFLELSAIYYRFQKSRKQLNKCKNKDDNDLIIEGAERSKSIIFREKISPKQGFKGYDSNG